MHSRGGRLAATTLSAAVGLVAVVLPFTTSGALPVGSDSGGSDGTDASLVTAPVPGDDSEPTEAVDRTIVQLDDVVAGLKDDPSGVLAPGDDTPTTTTTTPAEETPDDDGSGSEPAQPAPAEQSEADAAAESASGAESEAEPTGRVESVLLRLRALDGPPAAPPTIEPDLVSYVQPLLDYLDVPQGPRSTRDLVDRLRAAGASQAQIARILAPFPVVGPAIYGNDWGAPRHGPGPTLRRHEGTDLFAPRGTPVVAAFEGVVTRMGRDTAIGGNSVYLTTTGGDFLYYAHLDGFAPGLQEGTSVEPADVLGYVGTTGNAVATPPHLHFEIHPGGGSAIPPLPYLDAWLAQALDEARAFLGASGERPVFGPAVGDGGAGNGFPPLAAVPAAAAGDAADITSTVAGWLVILGAVGSFVAWRRRAVERFRRRLSRGRAPSAWSRRRPSGPRPDVLDALLRDGPGRADPSVSSRMEPEVSERDRVLVGAGRGRDGD